MNISRAMRQNGFTIVELLVVVVVVAILAAVVIIGYNGVKARADESIITGDLSGIVKQLETAKHTGSGIYPSSPSSLTVSAGSALEYSQTNAGAGYCATVTRSQMAYFISNDSTSKMIGSCPGQRTVVSGKYTLSDPDWSASQIPTLLNGSVATTLAGEAVTISGVLSAGTSTGSHIDGNTDTPANYCYPVAELDGVPCPTTPVPDMQITTGLTLTITANLVENAYNSFSFLMSDVENTTVTVRAYDSANVLLSSAQWGVSSYDHVFDSAKSLYVSASPADRPNAFTNGGSGITFTPMTSQNDDAMRVAFDLTTLSKLKRVTVAFASAATSDWVQWSFLARHK